MLASSGSGVEPARHAPFGNHSQAFAEPSWYTGSPSPYYGSSHVAFRKRVRDFVETHLKDKAAEWEEEANAGKELDLDIFKEVGKRRDRTILTTSLESGNDVPTDSVVCLTSLVAQPLRLQAYRAGVYAPMWPAELGGTPPTLPDGATVVPYDPFHDLIWMDELTRMGAAGVLQGFGIQTMALPVVLRFAPPEVRRKVVPGVVRGEKFISLCISEPTAGSDVADIRTTAELTPDGRHYIVNGLKKWITWAVHADFFTVAVRTGEPGSGSKGISLLLLEKTMPGITLRRMKLQGNWAGGTCLVEFSDVKVPVGNLIGEINKGFKAIMINFNHERFQIAIQASRSARMCLEEAVSYAKRRQTFGKRLVDHQVIRHKIAEMASIVESLHAQLEQCAYQMKHAGGGAGEQQRLGAVLSLLKVQASKGFEKCAREASQIIGGSAYTRGGKGGVVERLYREVRSVAIPGGSEEIMLDLAMKMSRL